MLVSDIKNYHDRPNVAVQIGKTCTQYALSYLLDVDVDDVINDLGDGDVHIGQIREYLYPRMVCDVDIIMEMPCGIVDYRNINYIKAMLKYDGLCYLHRNDYHMVTWKDKVLLDPSYGKCQMLYGTFIRFYAVLP